MITSCVHYMELYVAVLLAMLGAISKYISDVSVLRRLLFAVVHLPQDLPNLWGVAVEFATKGKESINAINSQQAKMFMENMHSLDGAAFSSDSQLLRNLLEFQVIIELGDHCGIIIPKHRALMLQLSDRLHKCWSRELNWELLPAKLNQVSCLSITEMYVRSYAYVLDLL